MSQNTQGQTEGQTVHTYLETNTPCTNRTQLPLHRIVLDMLTNYPLISYHLCRSATVGQENIAGAISSLVRARCVVEVIVKVGTAKSDQDLHYIFLWEFIRQQQRLSGFHSAGRVHHFSACHIARNFCKGIYQQDYLAMAFMQELALRF